MSDFEHKSWFNPTGYYKGKALKYSEGWLVAQIFFATNISKLDLHDKRILGKLYNTYIIGMLSGKRKIFHFVGHTDFRGSKKSNKMLSLARVTSVRQYVDILFKQCVGFSSNIKCKGEDYAIKSTGIKSLAGDRRVDVFAPNRIKQHLHCQAINIRGIVRRSVNELMIYDASDNISIDEAAEFLDSYKNNKWTVAIEGIFGIGDMNTVLDKYYDIKQISFSTHGSPGRVYFPNGSITMATLRTIIVPHTLFKGTGRLLFLGCQTAKGDEGRNFLIAAGRHFFAGKGGVVGGATISSLGFSSGTVLPIWGLFDFELGRLRLFRLDASGNVIAAKTVKPKLFNGK